MQIACSPAVLQSAHSQGSLHIIRWKIEIYQKYKYFKSNNLVHEYYTPKNATNAKKNAFNVNISNNQKKLLKHFALICPNSLQCVYSTRTLKTHHVAQAYIKLNIQ